MRMHRNNVHFDDDDDDGDSGDEVVYYRLNRESEGILCRCKSGPEISDTLSTSYLVQAI